MSERFTKLFALTENLYALESPVVIAAGALLKDNQTGKILAQIKFRNIGEKSIKAVKIKITPLDTVGRSLGEEIEYQYLDLSVSRDTEFGQKSPVSLPDNNTRAFSVEVTEVSFIDNTQWVTKGETWEQLSNLVLLEQYFNDRELAKQYKIKFGSQCKYFPKEEKDLWHCSCGVINRNSEVTCHRCKNTLADLFNVERDKLTSEMETRLDNEKAQYEKQEAEKQEMLKKAKKVAMVVVPIVIVVSILAAIFVPKIQKNKEMNEKYNNAIEQMEDEKYRFSLNIFEELGDFKNSKELYDECKIGCKYLDAKDELDKNNDKEAYSLFKELGDFKDSKDYLAKFEYKLINKEWDAPENYFGYTVDYEYDYSSGLLDYEDTEFLWGDWDPESSFKQYRYNSSGELEMVEENVLLSPYLNTVIEGVDYSCSNNRIIEGISENELNEIYYSYNKQGYVSKIEYDTWGDSLVEKYEYTYDDNNNIITEILYENGKKAYNAEYTYSDDGLISSVKYVAVNGQKDVATIDSKKSFVDYFGEVIINYNYGYVYVEDK